MSNTCAQCGEDKPRKNRAPHYKKSDVCSAQCAVAQHRAQNIAACMEDRIIAEYAERRGDDYWTTENVLAELCQRFGYISFLAVDQWWGVNFEGHWYYDPDLTYEFGEDDDSYGSIEGYLLGDEQTIGDRKYHIRIEPDRLNDGLIGLLAKCVKQQAAFKAAAETWEREHATEIRVAAKQELDRRLVEWSDNIKHMAQQHYDEHMRRLDALEAR